MGFGKRRQKPAGSAGQTMEMKQKGMKQKGATPVANPIGKSCLPDVFVMH